MWSGRSGCACVCVRAFHPPEAANPWRWRCLGTPRSRHLHVALGALRVSCGVVCVLGCALCLWVRCSTPPTRLIIFRLGRVGATRCSSRVGAVKISGSSPARSAALGLCSPDQRGQARRRCAWLVSAFLILRCPSLLRAFLPLTLFDQGCWGRRWVSGGGRHNKKHH